MKDREIVELFWKRSPQAVDALAMAYGTQLRRLAGNILSNPQDAEECVNDAYLGLWDSIPPARPQPLLPYALRVVRNLCLKRYHWNIAQKRNSQFDLAYSELESCLADHTGPEQQLNIPPQTGQQNGGNRSRVTVEMSPGVRLQVQAVE